MQRWKGSRQADAQTNSGKIVASPAQTSKPPLEGGGRRFPPGGSSQQRKKSPPPGGSHGNPAKPTTPTSPNILQVQGKQVPNSPRMSSAKSKKKMRTRTHRYTSNVFSMFNQAQIQEFKEAFNMIDQNRDGFVDKDDLIEMLTSLGKNPTDVYLDEMIGEAPGPINFTMFLTLFGEKLNGTDPEDVIQNAFACFDQRNTGVLTEEYLREIMTTMGDRWTDEMVDELLHGAPISNGLFDYIEFTRTLKHGARDKDEEPAEQPPTPKSAKPSSGGGQQGQPQSPRGSVPQQPLTQGSAKSPSKPLQPPPRRR